MKDDRDGILYHFLYLGHVNMTFKGHVDGPGIHSPGLFFTDF